MSQRVLRKPSTIYDFALIVLCCAAVWSKVRRTGASTWTLDGVVASGITRRRTSYYPSRPISNHIKYTAIVKDIFHREPDRFSVRRDEKCVSIS